MNIHEVLAELDRLYAAATLPEAEDFLRRLIAQAESAGDEKAQLALLNEQMGLYRVTGRQKQALALAERALALAEKLGLHGTRFHATVLLNKATALCVDGRPAEALRCYLRAEEIYDAAGAAPFEYASLLNNMSGIYSAQGEPDKAEDCLLRSRALLKGEADTEAELATNAVNLSMLAIRRGKPDEAADWIDTAMAYYGGSGLHDTHRASAIAAQGMLALSKGRRGEALEKYREALALTLAVFGECRDAEMLRINIAQLEKETETHEGT